MLEIIPPGQELWFAAAALAAILLAVFLLSYRHGVGLMLWRSVAVVLAIVVAWFVADVFSKSERGAQERALDAQASELLAHVLRPGSALGCLNGLGNPSLEESCRKAIFNSPEQVAAALSYVDAQVNLLTDAAALGRAPGNGAEGLERLRRAVERDDFGLVAQVLSRRGCSVNDCSAFGAMNQTDRVIENLKGRTFDVLTALHAPEWEKRLREQHVVSVPGQSTAPDAARAGFPPTTDSPAPGASPGQTVKFDYPSADSIPPVSIMDAEPTKRTTTTPVPPPRP